MYSHPSTGSSLPTFDDNALRHFTDIVNSNRLVTEKRKKFLLEVVRQSETAVLSSENPPLPPAEPRAPPPHEAFSLEADDEDSCHIPQVLWEGADEGEPIVDASPAAYEQDLDTPKAGNLMCKKWLSYSKFSLNLVDAFDVLLVAHAFAGIDATVRDHGTLSQVRGLLRRTCKHL